MPIHLLKGSSAEQRDCTVRQFDHPEVTDTPLHVELCDVEYAIEDPPWIHLPMRDVCSISFYTPEQVSSHI
jgi:hypothetical protein